MGKLILYLVGILYTVLGALLVFAPDMLKKKLFDKMKKIPLKKLCIAPIVVGILLLLAASSHRNTFFIVILGLLGVAKGVFFVVATEKDEKVNDWWFNKAKNNIYRIFGVIVILIGSIVLMGI